MGNCHEDQVAALVAPGWPAVEPKIDEIFGWLEDPNCTGYAVAMNFLRGVGPELTPHVDRGLRSGDPELRYALLTSLLPGWSREALLPLSPAIEKLVWEYDDWDVDIAALELLVPHKLGDAKRLKNRIDNRISGAESSLKDLRRLRDELSKD